MRSCGARSGLPVVVMTAFGAVDTAVAAMREGAADYLIKPLNIDELLIVLERALERTRLRARDVGPQQPTRSATASRTSSARRRRCSRSSRPSRRSRRAARPCSITGETGTGKELVAAAIHHRSPRASGPFVRLHCAALAETLLESELFGHERGAFTGADRRARRALRAGRRRHAVPRRDRRDLAWRRRSSSCASCRSASSSASAATRRSRSTCASSPRRTAISRRWSPQAQFREDLFYRLNVITLECRRCASGRRDIPLLAMHFLAALRGGERQERSTASATRRSHCSVSTRWPGNVRELENVDRARRRALPRAIRSSRQHLPPDVASPRRARSVP